MNVFCLFWRCFVTKQRKNECKLNATWKNMFWIIFQKCYFWMNYILFEKNSVFGTLVTPRVWTILVFDKSFPTCRLGMSSFRTRQVVGKLMEISYLAGHEDKIHVAQTLSTLIYQVPLCKALSQNIKKLIHWVFVKVAGSGKAIYAAIPR